MVHNHASPFSHPLSWTVSLQNNLREILNFGKFVPKFWHFSWSPTSCWTFSIGNPRNQIRLNNVKIWPGQAAIWWRCENIWLKPEHLLQVVTPLKVRFVQEVLKVNRLKVDGLGGGGAHVHQEKRRMIRMTLVARETNQDGLSRV